MKNFKFAWLIELVLFFIGFYLVYTRYLDESPEPMGDKQVQVENAPAGKSDEAAGEVVICIDVDEENGVPLLPKKSFSKYIDYLYCFSRIANSRTRIVVHYWFYDGKLEAKYRVNIQSGNAGWSKHEMSPNKKGDWSVQVRKENGALLGEAKFRLR